MGPLMVGALPGIPLGIYFLKTYEDVLTGDTDFPCKARTT